MSKLELMYRQSELDKLYDRRKTVLQVMDTMRRQESRQYYEQELKNLDKAILALITTRG